ncbi:MAG: SIMPL domain-containing protein [Planctomycetota bacterium]|jgi:uncharacterized protein YggE
MKKITLTALSIFFCTALVFAEPEIKGTPSELAGYLKEMPKHVTLSGKSEVKVQADKVVVEISVKTEDGSLETALKQNQNLRAKIVKSLKGAGIPADKIAASRFSSTPQYGFFGKRPSSYEVTNLMKITVSDEKGFQEVAKIVDTYREVEYGGFIYEHSNKKGLKIKVTEQACDDLSKKKALYESKFGLKLQPKTFYVVEADESNQVVFGAARARYNKSFSADRRAFQQRSPVVDEVSEELSPFGALIFTGHVTVEYEVIQNQE